MFTEFHKNDYSKGQTVYLLRINGKESCNHKLISEGTVSCVGRRFITVESGNQKLRFEFDEEVESIWQEYSCEQEYEIYLTKEAADEVIRKRRLQKNIRAYIPNLTSLSLEKLPIEHLAFLKAVLSFFSSFSAEKEISDILLQELPDKDKDTLYRKIWAEHVLEDIQSYADTAGIQISESEAKAAAKQYVNGKYDCNLSYWENIHNLLEKRDDDVSDEEVHDSSSCTAEDYSPNHSWDLGMSIEDFI